MALLGGKKKSDAPKVSAKKDQGLSRNLTGILLQPRITEKAGFMAEKSNVYVFNVANAATKHSVSLAMQEVYKVTPEKVSVVAVPGKKVFVRGKWGERKGGKKAYVYLKKGDKIEII